MNFNESVHQNVDNIFNMIMLQQENIVNIICMNTNPFVAQRL